MYDSLYHAKSPIPSPSSIGISNSKEVSSNYNEYKTQIKIEQQRLQTEKNELEKNIASINSDIQSNQDRIRSLTLEQKVANSSLKKLSEKNKMLSNRYAALDMKVGNLNGPGVEGQRLGIKNEMTNLERQLKENRSEIERHEGNIQRYSSDIQVYNRNNQQLGRDRDSLKSRLSDINSQLSKLNSSRDSYLDRSITKPSYAKKPSASGTGSKYGLSYSPKPTFKHNDISVWEYNYHPDNELYHSGKKGMKWGYTNGQRNGNRIAELIYNLAINGQTPEQYKASQEKRQSEYEKARAESYAKSRAKNYYDHVDAMYKGDSPYNLGVRKAEDAQKLAYRDYLLKGSNSLLGRDQSGKSISRYNSIQKGQGARDESSEKNMMIANTAKTDADIKAKRVAEQIEKDKKDAAYRKQMETEAASRAGGKLATNSDVENAKYIRDLQNRTNDVLTKTQNDINSGKISNQVSAINRSGLNESQKNTANSDIKIKMAEATKKRDRLQSELMKLKLDLRKLGSSPQDYSRRMQLQNQINAKDKELTDAWSEINDIAKRYKTLNGR